MNELIPQLEETPQWLGVAGTIAFLAFVFLGTAAFVLAGGAAPKQRQSLTKRQRTSIVLASVGALIAIVATFTTLGINSSIRQANIEETSQTAQAREEWVESHGVNVKKDTLENLDFPDTEPKADDEFGIAQVTKNKAVITITLAWEDGDFVLYGTDGQPLERLED